MPCSPTNYSTHSSFLLKPQLNLLYYTQPKDQEWVLIDNKGEIQVIKGEKELVDTFNKYKGEPHNLSMPPNPNWGWRVENGQYKIDVELDAACKVCDSMRLQSSDINKERKEQIKSILKMQTKIGITAIAEPVNNNLTKI